MIILQILKFKAPEGLRTLFRLLNSIFNWGEVDIRSKLGSDDVIIGYFALLILRIGLCNAETSALFF